MTEAEYSVELKDKNQIEVICGAESQPFPVGHRVADCRDTLKHVLNIPADAQPRVNGHEVGEDYVPKPGERLEFVPTKPGEKRVAWEEDELVAKYPWVDEVMVRQRLKEFAAAHPDQCFSEVGRDWYLDDRPLWLYLGEVLGPPHQQPTVNDPWQEPLSEAEQEVFQLITDEGPLSAKEIAKRVGKATSTVTRHLIPALKKKRGIKNKKGLGYYLPGHLPPD